MGGPYQRHHSTSPLVQPGAQSRNECWREGKEDMEREKGGSEGKGESREWRQVCKFANLQISKWTIVMLQWGEHGGGGDSDGSKLTAFSRVPFQPRVHRFEEILEHES